MKKWEEMKEAKWEGDVKSLSSEWQSEKGESLKGRGVRRYLIQSL